MKGQVTRITALPCIFLAIILQLQAQQFELHSQELPTSGTVAQYDFVNNFISVDTTHGQNISWDWSALVIDSIGNRSETFAPPNSAPFIGQFPTCNYYYVASGIVQAHLYGEVTSTAYNVIGQSIGPSVTPFIVPQRILDLPLVYGQQSFTSFDDGSIFTGTIDSECVGTGVLATPIATYNDVLLVRKFYTFNTGTQTIFEWYDGELGIRILTISSQNGNLSGEVLFNNIALGVSQRDITPIYLSVNNPVQSAITVNYRSSNRILASVYTASGTLMKQVELNEAPQQKSTTLALPDLAEGLYLLTIKDRSSGQYATKRFVKLNYAK